MSFKRFERQRLRDLDGSGVLRCVSDRAIERTCYVDAADMRPRTSNERGVMFHIAVFTLGRFSLLINGEQAEFGRKVPKRPLDLLKAIIAQGGRGLQPEQRTESLYLALKNARPVNQEMVN